MRCHILFQLRCIDAEGRPHAVPLLAEVEELIAAWVWCKLGREPTILEVFQEWSREQRKRGGEGVSTGKAFLNQYDMSGG